MSAPEMVRIAGIWLTPDGRLSVMANGGEMVCPDLEAAEFYIRSRWGECELIRDGDVVDVYRVLRSCPCGMTAGGPPDRHEPGCRESNLPDSAHPLNYMGTKR